MDRACISVHVHGQGHHAAIAGPFNSLTTALYMEINYHCHQGALTLLFLVGSSIAAASMSVTAETLLHCSCRCQKLCKAVQGHGMCMPSFDHLQALAKPGSLTAFNYGTRNSVLRACRWQPEELHNRDAAASL